MSAMSNYMEGKIVDGFLRNIAYTPAATVYLALFESDPAEDASGTETSYTDYARQASTWTAINGSGQTENAASISFPANGNPAASVTITHAAVFDAVSAGNMLFYGALDVARTLESTDILSFAAGAVTFTLD